jgi:Tyosinase C-terminal domain
MVAPTLAGMSYNFAAPTEMCDNCAVQEGEHLEITSTTNITPILRDYVKIRELESLQEKGVEPFLLDRLRWRVLMVRLFLPWILFILLRLEANRSFFRLMA